MRTTMTRLIDYAGLFPPAKLAMLPALQEYAAAKAGPYAWMLGRFIVPASRLPEYEAAAPGAAHERSIIVDAGGDALSWFGNAQRIFGELSGRPHVEVLEVPLPALRTRRETYEASIGQVAALASQAGMRDRPIYVEMPRDGRYVDLLPSAMESLARYGFGAKIRCGGVVAEAFPSVAEVAAFIGAAAQHQVPFKATAGLHHPVRHVDAATGFTMHGFLNILCASALVRRVDRATLERIVADMDADAFGLDDRGLRWRELQASDEEIAAAREHGFVAYGSCSFSEPVEDTIALAAR